MIYDWQIPAWMALAAQRAKLPHALLISGRPGLGKSALAETFAQALLCQQPRPDGLPCDSCQACNWFVKGNHPDFRRLQPESLVQGTEDEPPARKEKKKSDQIKIEQIRGTEGFLSVGTHRGGARIILIDPADAMNQPAQSALLKNLEEPPPGTLYLLVTSRPQRLLATIRSRCLASPVAAPASAPALAWLAAQGMRDGESALAAAAGAPLAALKLAETEDARRSFISKLAERDADPLALAQACDGMDPVVVVGWLQRWVYDLLLSRSAGRIRYNHDARPAIETIAKGLEARALAGLLRRLGEARALARHPLNARLYFEDLLLQYRSTVAPASRSRG